MSSISSVGEVSERGSRRKKLTDYLKAANDMRQSYQQTYLEKWTSNYFETNDDQSRSFGNSPSNSKAATNGNQELILFPSYAKRHTKSNRFGSVEYCHLNTIRNVQSHPKNVDNDNLHELQENQQQESFSSKEDQAVVDVDVRGWIYSPHKGPLTGKLKLLIGLARQLSGIPAPEALNQEQSSNQSPLVTKPNFNKHYLGNEPNQDAYIHGDAKNDQNASSGKFCKSESSYPTNISNDPFESKNLPKKMPWNLPSDMSQAEIKVANSNLMSRLHPFMANPLISMPVSIFFYNEKTSISKTVTTNETGHFTLRAALDFVPTHVRVLVSEELSVTELVKITEPKGVSLISDVDDTIKHTSITAGAREAFRNAFVRNLEELTIDGVREWYNSMYDMGVGIHYVSNSPWQLFPTLLKFSRGAGLPPGSYHLKHYNGMLQGILEPVSERKKPIIAKILSDFPERSFILVGDSGEADLEVYCDIVLSNPGRVIMVLIRDMMHDFFDSTTFYFDSIQNYSDSSPHKMNIKEGQVLQRVSNPTADQQADQSKAMPKVFLPTAGGPIMGKLVDVDQKSSQNNYESKKTSSAQLFSSVESGKGHQKNATPVTDERRKFPPRPPKPMALRAPPCESVSQQKNTPSNCHDPCADTQILEDGALITKQSIDCSYPYQILGKSVTHNRQPQRPYDTLRQTKSDYKPATPTTLDSPLRPPPYYSIKNASMNNLSSNAYKTNNDIFEDKLIPQGNPPINKKLESWRRRWKKAEQILESQDVKLRAWKVGEDAHVETVQVIHEQMQKIKI
ncbi:Bgt-1258 [Blumeria graminis f. sp. tritici]|uniref:Phosphatidate phosphatase APP1 catalytic domain-containing protein n=3 Tax=Blumeria graminis f. sp. tritici TaxID=62690 RepID=A0A656KNN4_BLUGR|nr:hypothetical protein BGT96224_1258 [Blumeria graminis f. sp. tritici 96224]VCU39784.1 Bgt-1258 [Blumeria graminis f. sp. tritici]